MEQLISQITQRTGISEDQARQAVDMVVTYLRGQLPGPLSAQVDGVLGSDTSPLGNVASQLPGMIGGMFDKK
jgi:hypothetical protein